MKPTLKGEAKDNEGKLSYFRLLPQKNLV